ncbi:glycoside hydrolase family 32 protein [Sinomonas sp. ASV322]|uniref:glycoside hydrolase family 32 protein n=1 Tax=Sinomonas sp. ASV322 TaxID=3041920 RepID=UPI0027DD87B0|nr:glycoside hydrolase family 32 protein [Sinomonas sp. ASV322]MDQ4501364.1 glycoside hydrolase family 32 protein [Sinomonas sp. ASV322]
MARIRFPGPRRPLAVVAVAALAVVALALVVLAVGTLAFQARSAHKAETPAAPAQTPASDPYRPAFHNAPAAHWMNDPQRPILIDGVWHAYYLYNADYPHGNGTSWRHMTSTDLVHWKDEGTAIEKFANGLGDVETGSVVVDVDGSAGFGKGALVAVVTQQLDGVQRQSLFASTDGGRSFASYGGNPIMPNPGAKDWRDPKIIRDDAHGQWVMALAEGHKIGFYTSKDLRAWSYASGFETQDLGVLECPDLFELNLDGDPQRPRWVLMAGANGAAEGRTTGTAYWTGAWDGTRFVPDASDGRHQWADDGPDLYAAVTWDDPRLSPVDRLDSRYLMGWMNNWAYAGGLPTGDWAGADSIVRTVRLKTVDGAARLTSEPVPAIAASGGSPRQLSGTVIEQAQPGAGAFALDAELERAPSEGTEASIQLASDGRVYATVGYDFGAGRVFVERGQDAFARSPSSSALSSAEATYRAARAATGAPGAQRVRLRVYVDRSSVEVFVDDGSRSLTALTFAPPGARSVRIQAPHGSVSLWPTALGP